MDVAPTLAAQLAVSASAHPDEVHAAFAVMRACVTRNALVASGTPRVIYTTWMPRTSFTVALPIATAPEQLHSSHDVMVVRLAGSRVRQFVHRGPYQTLHATYGRIEAWLRHRGHVRTEADWARYAGMWEEHPRLWRTVPDNGLDVRIYLPLEHGRLASLNSTFNAHT